MPLIRGLTVSTWVPQSLQPACSTTWVPLLVLTLQPGSPRNRELSGIDSCSKNLFWMARTILSISQSTLTASLMETSWVGLTRGAGDARGGTSGVAMGSVVRGVSTVLENVVSSRALCSAGERSSEAGEETWTEVCRDARGKVVLFTGFLSVTVAFWMKGSAENAKNKGTVVIYMLRFVSLGKSKLLGGNPQLLAGNQLLLFF